MRYGYFSLLGKKFCDVGDEIMLSLIAFFLSRFPLLLSFFAYLILFDKPVA